LKDVAPRNMFLKVVAFEVSQPEMSPLKFLQNWKRSLMSVTLDTSHSEMGSLSGPIIGLLHPSEEGPKPMRSTRSFFVLGCHAPRAPSENMHVAIKIATCVTATCVTKCSPRDMIAHLTVHRARCTRSRRLFPSF